MDKGKEKFHNVALNARRIFILDRRGPDRVVVGFTATCAISAYDH